MNLAEFASLCDISKPMVSKYKAAGLIVLNGKAVDARASLALLSGRLDEDKHRAALGRLDMGPVAMAPAKPGEPEKVLTGKARKDHFAGLSAELDFRKKAGELLSVSEVAATADHAVAAMRESFGNSRRDIAQAFCAQFGLSPEHESAVARFLGEKFERALGRFAEVCSTMAEPKDEVVTFAGEFGGFDQASLF